MYTISWETPDAKTSSWRCKPCKKLNTDKKRVACGITQATLSTHLFSQIPKKINEKETLKE